MTGERRIMNWTAVFDEVHDLEVITRGVLGGVGAIVWKETDPPASSDRIIFDGTGDAGHRTAQPQNGLNGSTIDLMRPADAASSIVCAPGGEPCVSVNHDWDDIDAFVRQIRSPRAPSERLEQIGLDQVEAGRQLFVAARCAGCHGDTQWTTSRLFYTPSQVNNDPEAGLLRQTKYNLPAGFPPTLNPVAADGGSFLRYVGPDPSNEDQIRCVLRNVGTYPEASTEGVSPGGGLRVLEVRQNMTAPAQGALGFNPPSLLGLTVGAPYFHAGNARTLEEAFDAVFTSHHAALAPNPFAEDATRAVKLRQLVLYLLSIDERTPPVPVPIAELGFDPHLCPDAL
jgi:hypothetical protein